MWMQGSLGGKDKALSVREHKEKAQQFQRRGKYQNALRHWERVVHAAPKDFSAHLSLCNSLRRLGLAKECGTEHVALSKKFRKSGQTTRALAIARAGLEVDATNTLLQEIEVALAPKPIEDEPQDIPILENLSSGQEAVPAIGLFSPLDRTARIELCDLVHTQTLRPGETLLSAGDNADAVYIVSEGEVRVSRRQGDSAWRVITHLGAGEVVGEQAVLARRTHSAEVVAARDTKVLKIDADVLNSMIARYPEVSRAIYTRFFERWILNVLSSAGTLSQLPPTERKRCFALFNVLGVSSENPVRMTVGTRSSYAIGLGGDIYVKAESKFRLASSGLKEIRPPQEGVLEFHCRRNAFFAYISTLSCESLQKNYPAVWKTLESLQAKANDGAEEIDVALEPPEDAAQIPVLMEMPSFELESVAIPQIDPGEAILVEDPDIPRVSDFMSRAVHEVSEAYSLLRAVELMKSESISCVLVCDESGRPVGVFSERDLVWVMELHLGSQDMRDVEIHTCMSSPIISIGQDATLDDAIVMMEEHHIRRLPVVGADNRLHGILTQTDALRALVQYSRLGHVLGH